MNKKSLIAILLCLILCKAAIFSTTFIAAETGHECSTTRCPICEEMQTRISFLQAFSLAGSILITLLCLAALFYQRPTLPAPGRTATLISLKVKLTV